MNSTVSPGSIKIGVSSAPAIVASIPLSLLSKASLVAVVSPSSAKDSKKLKSGKCQVKFSATLMERKDMYGYVLVEPYQTLKEVVSGIRTRLTTIHRTRDFQNLHLYSIGKSTSTDLNFLVFDS